MPYRRTWLRAAVYEVVLMLFALSCQASGPQGIAELPKGTPAMALTPHLSYLHDKSAVDTPEDAWRKIAAGGFQRVPKGKTAFGFQQCASWFYVF